MAGLRISRIMIALLAFMMATLACNVQFGEGLNAPVRTPTTTVVFIAPGNNSVIAEGATIVFAVSVAGSEPGTAKVDFLVNDTSIGSQTAQVVPGQASVTLRQTWTAKGVQGHLISAQVSRGGAPIGEARITIRVVPLPTRIALIVTDEASSPTTAPTYTSQPKPTASPTPTQTEVSANVPNTSALPAAGANLPVLTVTYQFLNVRAGPGTNYGEIGKMNSADTATILGRNSDASWWFVRWEREQVQGWVINNSAYSTVMGDTSGVPLVATSATPLPPTPTSLRRPTLAPTSTIGNFADLVIDQISLNPPAPLVNQTFIVTIVVRNQGNVEARAGLLSGLFQPGNERSDIDIPPLKPGQSVARTLPVTLKAGGQNQVGKLTIDANNEIDEGSNGEANNVRTFTYSVN